MGVKDREVALVGEHGLADDLLRDLEELLVEGANKHRRPLTEVDNLVEGALGGVHAAAGTGGLDVGDPLADDLLAALG